MPLSKKYVAEELRKTIEQIDSVVPQIKRWPEALAMLCLLCERHEITLRFQYSSGWFQRPHGDDQEPFLDKDEQGYTIEVGLSSFQDERGRAAVYKKATYAVYDGIRLLRLLLVEHLGELGESYINQTGEDRNGTNGKT